MITTDPKQPIVVAFGGGVNSTAMLVEMHKRSIIPDLILFADTGGERPETYRAVKLVSEWCINHGLPSIVIVKNDKQTLEEDCIRRNALPSVAYGWKTCSERWKVRPQNRYIKTHLTLPVTKAIGFDAGEERRAKPFSDKDFTNWYPLVEWGIFREDCVEICKENNLPVSKSSCFFCPNMKKHEILDLQKNHPELMERAIAMEKNAHLTTIKGLGRSFAWSKLDNGFEVERDMPCGCYDG